MYVTYIHELVNNTVPYIPRLHALFPLKSMRVPWRHIMQGHDLPSTPDNRYRYIHGSGFGFSKYICSCFCTYVLYKYKYLYVTGLRIRTSRFQEKMIVSTYSHFFTDLCRYFHLSYLMICTDVLGNRLGLQFIVLDRYTTPGSVAMIEYVRRRVHIS